MLFAPKVFPSRASLSHAGKSIYGWSFYTLLLALLLLLSPGTFLRLTGTPPDPTDPGHFFIRMFGALLLSMSFMAHQAAVLDVRPFYTWAIIGRTFIALVVVTCSVNGLCGPLFGAFALIEFAGAMGTFIGVRKDAAAVVTPAMRPPIQLVPKARPNVRTPMRRA